MSGGIYRKSIRRKSMRRKSMRRKSMRRKSMRRKSMRRKSMRRKSMKRSNKRRNNRKYLGGVDEAGGAGGPSREIPSIFTVSRNPFEVVLEQGRPPEKFYMLRLMVEDDGTFLREHGGLFNCYITEHGLFFVNSGEEKSDAGVTDIIRAISKAAETINVDGQFDQRHLEKLGLKRTISIGGSRVKSINITRTDPAVGAAEAGEQPSAMVTIVGTNVNRNALFSRNPERTTVLLFNSEVGSSEESASVDIETFMAICREMAARHGSPYRIIESEAGGGAPSSR